MDLKGLDFLYHTVRREGWKTRCCYALSFGELSTTEHEALFQLLKQKLTHILQDPLHFLRIEIQENQHNYSSLPAEKLAEQQLISTENHTIRSIFNEDIYSAKHFFVRSGNKTTLYFTFLHEIIDGIRALKSFQKHIIDKDEQAPFLLPNITKEGDSLWAKKHTGY